MMVWFPRVLCCVVAKTLLLTGVLPCIALLFSVSSHADAIVDDATISNAMQSVVAIYRPSINEQDIPIGAGFFITIDGGYLLTAYHVVAPSSEENKGTTFKLKLGSGIELEARLIGQNDYLDVALLKTILPSDSPLWRQIKPLPLKDNMSDHLAILGHPIQSDRQKLFDHTDVLVSDRNRNGLVAVSPSAEAGYSGGPVIDDTGSAVAIALGQSEMSPITFVRTIDTLGEFLETNEIIKIEGGYEKHLSLSSLATIEEVATLEKELNSLKEEESKKQRLMDDITRQLWNLKSQVQWVLSVCEIQSQPNGLNDASLPTELHAEPKHRLTIEYKKIIGIMFDAIGVFTASITPLMPGEGESQKGLAEARKRRLYVAKNITFDGQKWVFEQLDDDVEAKVRNYNETRDATSAEVDVKNIDSFLVSLKPPKGDDEMKFFGFTDKVVKFVGGKNCE
jgi:hypothetical protein